MEKTQLEGFFLSFTPQEMKDLREALPDAGYEPDGTGLKNLILDTLYADEESDTDRFIDKARRYVSENPDKIRKGIDLAIGLVGMLKAKR